jgi:hypothetical protein
MRSLSITQILFGDSPGDWITRIIYIIPTEIEQVEIETLFRLLDVFHLSLQLFFNKRMSMVDIDNRFIFIWDYVRLYHNKGIMVGDIDR